MRTIGSEALAAKLAKHGDMTKFAEKLGVLPNIVSRWASGQRVPRMPMLIRLRDEAQIPVEAWGIPAAEPASDPPAPTGTGGH
jgi:transcriptional regulator with XRE-family HTH domain